MEPVALTIEMVVVFGLLAFTIFLFASEIIRVDLAAIVVLVLLGLLSQLPGLGGLADINHLFDGFASNAVISIIAVMILGAGLDKTGLMTRVASLILRYGGATERRVVPIVSGTVGVISSFMQNVGAAALFLPVVSRISARTQIPLSRLLMPMGFCAILGGTLTLVGSSPLILLNDLMASANADLGLTEKLQPFGLFSVTPVGAALLATGVLYFMLLGRWLLPVRGGQRGEGAAGQSMNEYLQRIYGLRADIVEVKVPEGNILLGQTFADIMDVHHCYIIGSYYRGQRWVAPPLDTKVTPPCRLAILGQRAVIEEMADIYGLEVLPELDVFAEEFSPARSGVAEIVIPPDSALIGKSARDVALRKTYGLSLLAIHRGETTMSLIEDDEHEATRISHVPFQAGDTLVVHVPWDRLTRLKKDRNFVVVTSDFPQEEIRPQKVVPALAFFAIAIGLVLFTDLQLSLCLLTGAAGMLVTRVLTPDEAYQAVGWNTVFLLASLIPLGHAVQSTGTAQWIAHQVLGLLEGVPHWVLQAAIAILATGFTLVMSNVGATVLLVPLAISIAAEAGADPALFALTVAISTSNSFLIPTHQVNALIMGPAGYTVSDFVRAGGMMTLLFLVVSLTMLNLVF